ncbi:MAG: hydrogenase/sulfur reductase, alpha subunit [Candidatus Jettenia ecosi]|uniref:Hydrogenase/sulfur reductase, alpha subunit n=1 Tax=Candidatus Jettenia ecosi TaxID=2494326 RepID=A0A533Q9R9_9BACT|nr:MAG: hydrogenase/sulfur reductase, alpha subunit [Candidatus Jettenia ecosi]
MPYGIEIPLFPNENSSMKNDKAKTKTIKVDYLARVEGEGALYVKIKGNTVTDVKFKIFEPPRFFEAFLRGRSFCEAPDITARICGICPVAYQMSSSHAMEDAFGIRVDGQLRALRRLLYCGEWIESHALHVYLLHAPDFFGYDDAIQMAKDYPDIVQRGLQLKKTGNEVVILIGGREIHPINVRVGGFYKALTKQELNSLTEKLKRARDIALEAVSWTAEFDYPDFEQDYEFVALRHPDEYPFNEGKLISNKGLDIFVHEYDNHFIEEQIAYTNALHSKLKERGAYFVGPLARFNLNFDRLSPLAKEAAHSAGLSPVCRNPFKSIIVRSVEMVYACDEALRIIGQYEKPEIPAIPFQPTAGTGYGCTEAPRGILYHRYRVDDNGRILDAKIVPSTSQNQKTIENDLWQFIPKYLDLPSEKLKYDCEKAIRNYDPCISCATHFLKLNIDRE